MDISDLLQGIKDGIDELVKLQKTGGRNGAGSGSGSGSGAESDKGKEKKEKSTFEKVSAFFGGGYRGARSAASGVQAGNVAGAGAGLARGAAGLGSRAIGALGSGGAAAAAGGAALGVGAAVVGIAAVGAAAAAAGVAITKLAAASVESARALAGVNATLAVSFATAEIRNTQRNIGYAGVTADSTAALQESLQDLYDAVAPIQALIRNAWNGFLQWSVEIITYIVNIAKLLPWIGDKIAAIEAKMNEKEPNLTPLNQFFNNLSNGNFRAVRDPLFNYGSDDAKRRGR